MEILKSLFRSIVRLVAINIALILFSRAAPLALCRCAVVVVAWRQKVGRYLQHDSNGLSVLRSVRLRVLDDYVCHWQTCSAKRDAKVG